jgi:diguanylate cyclase (GGDEF)-like protein
LPTSFRKKINFGFAFSVLLILFFACYAIYVSRESEKAKNQMKETFQLIDQIRDINYQIKDLEIFKQEFLLTAKEKSLMAYYEKLSTTMESLERLKLKSDFLEGESQKENLNTLLKMISNKLKCDEECIKLRRSKNYYSTMKWILEKEEEHFLQDARILLDKMEQVEKFSLYEKQDKDLQNSKLITMLIILGSPFTVFIYVVLIYVINNDIKIKAIQESQLQLLSITDELTGLYNRRGFLFHGNKIFQESNKEKRRMFLYFIDMDGLKIINDTLGHKAGDEAIQALSKILKQSFRLTDLIARMGGDEFAVIVVDSHVSSDTVINRLQRKLEDFNNQGDYPYRLSASIGFEEYDPEKHMTIEEMVEMADKKMYHHKSKSRKNRT